MDTLSFPYFKRSDMKKTITQKIIVIAITIMGILMTTFGSILGLGVFTKNAYADSQVSTSDNPVAVILDSNSGPYYSIQDAINASKANQIIQIISDTFENNIMVDKKITIDLNGHIINGHGGSSVFIVGDTENSKNGDLTIIDNNPNVTHYFVSINGGVWTSYSGDYQFESYLHWSFLNTIPSAKEAIEINGGVITGADTSSKEMVPTSEGDDEELSDEPLVPIAGIYVNNGSALSLEGGKIIGNSGAGIYLDGSAKLVINPSSENYYYYYDGVLIAGNKEEGIRQSSTDIDDVGSIEMSGGYIIHNGRDGILFSKCNILITGGYVVLNNGIGINIKENTSSGTITMTGGYVIYNNGGVKTGPNVTIKLGGDAIINRNSLYNLYLIPPNTIIVGNKVNDNVDNNNVDAPTYMEVGITLPSNAYPGQDKALIFIENNASEYGNYFFSDNLDFKVSNTSSYVVIEKNNYEWTYNYDSNEIYGVRNDGYTSKYPSHYFSLYIDADVTFYDGYPHPAYLIYMNFALEDEPTITYYKMVDSQDEQEEYELIEGLPIEIGTYKASVTYLDQTIYYIYSIKDSSLNENPIIDPIDDPNGGSSDDPTGDDPIIDEPIIDEPIIEPIWEPIEEPIEEPVEEPVINEPVEEPIEEPKSEQEIAKEEAQETINNILDNVSDETKEAISNAMENTSVETLTMISDSLSKEFDELEKAFENVGKDGKIEIQEGVSITKEEAQAIVQAVAETTVMVAGGQQEANARVDNIVNAIPNSEKINLSNCVNDFYERVINELLGKQSSSSESYIGAATKKDMFFFVYANENQESSRNGIDFSISPDQYRQAIEFVNDSVDNMTNAARRVKACSGMKVIESINSYISGVSAMSFRNYDKAAADEAFFQAAYNAILLNLQEQTLTQLENIYNENKGKVSPSKLIELTEAYNAEVAKVSILMDLENETNYDTFEYMVVEVMRQKYISLLNTKLTENEIDQTVYNEQILYTVDKVEFKPKYISIFKSWTLQDESYDDSPVKISLEELSNASIENSTKKVSISPSDIDTRIRLSKVESTVVITIGIILLVMGAYGIITIFRRKEVDA